MKIKKVKLYSKSYVKKKLKLIINVLIDLYLKLTT